MNNSHGLVCHESKRASIKTAKLYMICSDYDDKEILFCLVTNISPLSPLCDLCMPNKAKPLIY